MKVKRQIMAMKKLSKKPAAPAKSSSKSARAKQTTKKVAVKKIVTKNKTKAKASPKKPVAKKPVAKKAVATKPQLKKPALKPREASAKARVVTKASLKTVAKPVGKPVAKIAAKEPNPALHLVEKKAVTAKAPVKANDKKGFAVGDYVVYPTHGVGRITANEVEVIGEYELKVFVINFEKDKMILRVPVGRATAAGLRGISGSDDITRALATLKGRAKTARGMWSRRAQEYESKINSGNIVQIAEVVRDLHKNVDQSERSYSERMIYETAMNRLIGEVAAFNKVDQPSAHDSLLKVLKKQAA